MIRVNNAERRLVNAQNQLAAAEEKMAAMNQKTTAADSKWEARVKEYETRLRTAEEKVKRERQGYKERVLELENQTKCVSFGRPYGSNVVLIGSFVGLYRDKGNSLRSVIISWQILRPRCPTSRRHQRDSPSLWVRAMTFSPHFVFSCRLSSSAQLSNDALLLVLTTSHVNLCSF
jgi:hypothetical protein